MTTAEATPVAPAPTWCLRLQSGVLRGRTIALHPGSNVLGSSGECDVMLPGGDVLPRHLVLTVGELVVSVQKLGTATAQVNGEELKQRRSLVAGDALTIGSIEVQLDRSYPAIEAEDMFAPEQAAPSTVAREVPVEAPLLRQPYLRAGLALGTLALAGLVVVTLLPHGRGPAGSVAAHLAEVERIVAAYPEVEVIAQPGGQIVLRGYVESRARKASLQQVMGPFGSGVAVHVHAAEDMVEQARRYIADPGVAVQYAGQGRLLLTGTVDDESVRQKVRRLSEDLHPTVLVSDKVQYRPKERKDETDPNAQWAAWQSILPARMVGITDDGNGLRHIQLSNGTRYYEGSVLRSGAELKRIDADGLVLSGGNDARPGDPK